MAQERVKLFKGDDPEKLEAKINTWLSSLPPQADIQGTEMALATQNLNGQLMIVISVWYVIAKPDSIQLDELNASNHE